MKITCNRGHTLCVNLAPQLMDLVTRLYCWAERRNACGLFAKIVESRTKHTWFPKRKYELRSQC